MRVHKILVCGCAMLAASNLPVYAAMGLSESIYLAGQVQPVIATKLPNGQWQNAKYKMLIGMERIPGSGNKRLIGTAGLVRFRLVVDASQITGGIPAACAKRLVIPWKELEKSLVVESGWRHPVTVTIGDNELQKFSWVDAGCQVTILGKVPMYFGPENMPQIKEFFPGLQLRTGIPLKQGILMLSAEGKAVQVEFVALQKDLPGFNPEDFND